MFILSLVIPIVTFAATSCLNNNHKVESGDNTLYGHIAANRVLCNVVEAMNNADFVYEMGNGYIFQQT